VDDPPASHDAPVVFYDGGCGLCHAAVRLLLRLDRHGRLRFAPLGGETFAALVPEPARRALPDSLVLREADGRLTVRSAAALDALRVTGGIGAALAALARVVPRALADGVYDGVARTRRRLFAPPPEACPRVPPRLRERFLP
jgi:predicted DCC family thiol-disulfide oxidoreductase YuxK